MAEHQKSKQERINALETWECANGTVRGADWRVNHLAFRLIQFMEAAAHA